LRHWVIAALLLGSASAAHAETAVLQGLNKITARISTFNAPQDRAVRFGSLEIIARACHKTPPEETPESAAFLQIVDVRPDSEAVELFTGWMFASSPAVSAMEHPVYDVWVIDCKPYEESDDPDYEEASGEEAFGDLERGIGESDIGDPVPVPDAVRPQDLPDFQEETVE